MCSGLWNNPQVWPIKTHLFLLVFSRVRYSVHEPHSHFNGALVEMLQHPFAGMFYVIILPVVGVLFPMVSMV